MNQDLVHRYQDSYRSAGSTVRFGTGLRSFGLLIGMGAIFAGLIMLANGCRQCGVELLAGGAVTALVLAVAGVLVATLGRILRATLDSSVSSNAALSQHEKGHLMNIER